MNWAELTIEPDPPRRPRRKQPGCLAELGQAFSIVMALVVCACLWPVVGPFGLIVMLLVCIAFQMGGRNGQ